MKKLFGLMAVLALFLAACGSEDKSETPAATEAEQSDDTADDAADDTTDDGADDSTDDGADDITDDGADGPAAGSTGLADAQKTLVDAGFSCDGEITNENTEDGGIEPAPVELFDCPQDDGLALIGVGWASEDEADQGVQALDEAMCGMGDFSYMAEEDWAMMIMEVGDDQGDDAEELLIDMSNAFGDYTTVVRC